MLAMRGQNRSFAQQPVQDHPKWEVFWVVLLGVYAARDMLREHVDPFFLATSLGFGLGAALALAVRVLGAAWDLRSRALVAPMVLTMAVALLFENRLFLLPIYALIILGAGFLLLAPSSRVELTSVEIELHNFGMVRRVPYEEIAGIAHSIGNRPRVNLTLREPIRRLGGLLGTTH
jgi:hypothetical protein